MIPPLSVMDFQQIDTNQAYLAWSLSQNRKTGGCKKQWAQFVFASLHTTSPHSAYCMKIWLGSTTYAQECTTWLLPIIVSTLRHMSVTEPNLPWFCNEITVQCSLFVCQLCITAHIDWLTSHKYPDPSWYVTWWVRRQHLRKTSLIIESWTRGFHHWSRNVVVARRPRQDQSKTEAVVAEHSASTLNQNICTRGFNAQKHANNWSHATGWFAGLFQRHLIFYVRQLACGILRLAPFFLLFLASCLVILVVPSCGNERFSRQWMGPAYSIHCHQMLPAMEWHAPLQELENTENKGRFQFYQFSWWSESGLNEPRHFCQCINLGQYLAYNEQQAEKQRAHMYITYILQM